MNTNKMLSSEIFTVYWNQLFFSIDVAREVTFLSISWLKSKRHWKADMAKFMTTRTLLIRIKMFLKNAVDWSFNYLYDSLSVISWLHSCNERYQFVRRDWRLTLHAVFILNYPGTRKKTKFIKIRLFPDHLANKLNLLRTTG